MRPLSALSSPRLPPLYALAAAYFAGIALAGSPDPAGARMWIAHSDQDIVSLAYGLPESDDVPLSLVCDRAAKTVTISYQIEPVSNPAPENLSMEFSAGSARLTLTAKGSRAELDDLFIVEASTPATPELGQIFAQATSLSVLVDGRTAEFPIDEIARKGAEEIVKGCAA